MNTSFIARQAKRNGSAIEFPIENGTYRVTVRVERNDRIAMDRDPILVYSAALKSLTISRGYGAS